MLDYTNRRYRRPQGRNSGRGWRTTFVVVAAAGLFAVGVSVGLDGPPPTSGPPPTIDAHAAGTSVDAVGITSVSLPNRPNFSYSVIPGGARNAQELAHAIESDSVVANAYRDVDPETMRTEIVAAQRLAYVSYRVNDRVFWTKKKVRIYEGETILSNGQTEIRGRCGNGISMAPLLPTSDDEPGETEFDALTDVGPLLVSFNLTPAGLPLVLAPPLSDGPVGAPLAGSLGMPFGGGAGGFASGAGGGEPNGDTPADLVTGFANGAPSDGSPGNPGFMGDPSVFDPGAPGDPGDPGDPSEPDPLVLQPLLGPDSDPDPPRPSTFDEPPPTNPIPVPEPATLLLFGSGLAGLIARHRRRKTN